MPLINKATRVKSESVTLIDNIFTNTMSDNAYQGIMFTNITDYFPNLLHQYELQTDNTIESFGNELATMSWDKILDHNSVCRNGVFYFSCLNVYMTKYFY